MDARAAQLLGGLQRPLLAGSSADIGAPHHSRIHLPILPTMSSSSGRAQGSGCSLFLPPLYAHLGGARHGILVLAVRFGASVISLTKETFSDKGDSDAAHEMN